MAYMWNHRHYMAQLYKAEIFGEKVQAAIIMQAWIDGYEVTRIMDEIILEPKKD